MFLRYTKVRRGSAVLEYASIAERTIENGRQKTKTLKYLGPVKSESDRERYRRIFQEYREAMKKFSLTDLRIKPTLSFGVFHASKAIMDRCGISAVLERHTGTYAGIISFMISSRLFEASSDIDLLSLRERVYYPWELNMSKDNIYRSLDAIIEEKDRIETDLFDALKPDTSTVHYDLTSSYFEGREENDLVLFGYSRDKKRGKEQIVIGLVMADGIPIHHEVWPGNTIDPKTLEDTISFLKDRFGIKNMIFIADRAFGRSRSIDLLDRNQYITAAYRWDQPYRNTLIGTDFTDGHPMDGLIVKEVKISPKEIIKYPTEDQLKFAEKRRYIAVYNPDREKLDLMDLEEKIGAVKKKISEIHDPGDLKKSLGSLKSLVKFFKNDAVLNERRIDIIRKLAGRFLIVTNTDLPYGEIVSAYKEQWKVERAFRTIKSFLDIRPVYHRRSERIRAHVFICALSFLVSAIMEKSTGRSIESIRRDLNRLDVVPVTVENRKFYVSSDSPEASSILKSLKIPYPRIHESAHT